MHCHLMKISELVPWHQQSRWPSSCDGRQDAAELLPQHVFASNAFHQNKPTILIQVTQALNVALESLSPWRGGLDVVGRLDSFFAIENI